MLGLSSERYSMLFLIPLYFSYFVASAGVRKILSDQSVDYLQ